MSKPSKKELIEKIKQQNYFTQEEKTELIGLLNKRKRYGLVWEDKPEDAEEVLKENLPLLQEVKERAIINNDSAATPNHILIEGDNLHALTSLCFTHEGMVDVIYIDPPYNTGNKDFKYNDDYVDKEDNFRHSKWLSFMNRRLKIAKRLLKENGIIFISIDDNEVAPLKMLCDEIFLEEKLMGIIHWRKNRKPHNAGGTISKSAEYIIVYSRIDKIKLVQEYTIKDTDETGDFSESPIFKSDKIHRTYEFPAGIRCQTDKIPKGINESARNPKLYIEYLDEPIIENGILQNAVKIKGRYCVTDVRGMLSDEIKKGNIFINKNGVPKCRVYREDLLGKVANNLWVDKGYNEDAHEEISEIFNVDLASEIFDYPKPLKLIKEVLKSVNNKTSLVLDFFAGSGTTLNATMQLNSEDDGTRQCIIVTNNENTIAENVTYERNKRVIEGYTKPNGEEVEGLRENNLRYFKTEMVSRATTLKNKRQITQLATDLLRIKENCYTETKSKELGAKSAELRVFSQNGKTFMVVYDDVYIPKAVEAIKALDGDIKVYVFAEGQEPYREDFEDVVDRVVLCALPDAIYKAYQHVLPKQKKEIEKLMV